MKYFFVWIGVFVYYIMNIGKKVMEDIGIYNSFFGYNVIISGYLFFFDDWSGC